VFPYLAIATLVAAALIAWLVVRHDPNAGAGEGATVSEA
jgi:hypothetical protein